MKFFTFPNATKRPMSPSEEDLDKQIVELQAVEKLGVISAPDQGTVALANGKHYNQIGGAGIPWNLPGNVKTWFNANGDVELVFAERDANGDWASVANTDSVEGLQWTSRPLMDFYKLYRNHFPKLPKFVRKKFNSDEATRMQFGDGPAMDFPIVRMTSNGVPTLRPDIGFRLTAGELEVFSIVEYQKEFPLVVTATITPVNFNPSMRLMQVSLILQNTSATAEAKDKMIEVLYRGAPPKPVSHFTG